VIEEAPLPDHLALHIYFNDSLHLAALVRA
jgi:hypothetical protein